MRPNQTSSTALVCAALSVVLSACASRQQVLRDIKRHGDSLGISPSRQRNAAFAESADLVFFCLWSALRQRSAHFVACDPAMGILSWCELGSAFRPIPSRPQMETPHLQGRNVTAWNGTVYANARVVRHRDKTHLSIYARARRQATSDDSLSDGSFEDGLLLSIERSLERVRSGMLAPAAVEPTVTTDAARPQTYREAYEALFAGVACPTLADLRRAGIAEPFPTAAERFWDAWLHVAAQSSMVAALSALDRACVVVRNTTLPAEGSERLRRVEVFLAVGVEPASADQCVVRIGLLDPRNLGLLAIPRYESKSGNAQVVFDFTHAPAESAAAVVAAEITDLVAAQLFAMDRLGDKLHRRRTVDDPGAPSLPQGEPRR